MEPRTLLHPAWAVRFHHVLMTLGKLSSERANPSMKASAAAPLPSSTSGAPCAAEGVWYGMGVWATGGGGGAPCAAEGAWCGIGMGATGGAPCAAEPVEVDGAPRAAEPVEVDGAPRAAEGALGV